MTEDLELLVERRPVVGQRPRIVLALVVRKRPRRLARARDPRRGADVAAHGDPILIVVALGSPHARAQPFCRPGRLRTPFAAHLREIGSRTRRAPHEDRDRRLLVDAVSLVAQPAREPADELGDEVDVRTGDRRRRRRVRPGADDHAARTRHRLVRPEGDVRVAVGPAGDDHRRARDALVVRPERSVPPVRPVVLLLEPVQEPRRGCVDAASPLLAPAVAVHRGNRRQHVARGHVDHPVDEVDRLQDPAHVVDVVRVAVVRRVDRDDGVERGRALHRDLERVEPAPRRAVHTDLPGAPVLLREPGDHRADVRLLLRVVLVESDPFRRARAAEIEPADREATLVAEALVLARVRGREVVHAVRERVDDDRSGELARQEEARGEPRPVLHRDPDVPMLHASGS